MFSTPSESPSTPSTSKPEAPDGDEEHDLVNLATRVHSPEWPERGHPLWGNELFVPATVLRLSREMHDRPVEAADQATERIADTCGRMEREGRPYSGYVLDLPSVGNIGLPLFLNPLSQRTIEELVRCLEDSSNRWKDWTESFFVRLRAQLNRESLPLPKIFSLRVRPPNVWDGGCDWLIRYLEDSHEQGYLTLDTLLNALVSSSVEEMKSLLDIDSQIMSQGNIHFRSRVASLQKAITDSNLERAVYRNARENFPGSLCINKGLHSGSLYREEPFVYAPLPGYSIRASSPDFTLPARTMSHTGLEGWLSRLGLISTWSRALDHENICASAAASTLFELVYRPDRSMVVPWIGVPGVESHIDGQAFKVRLQYLKRVLSVVREYEVEDCILDTTPDMGRKQWTSVASAIGQP